MKANHVAIVLLVLIALLAALAIGAGVTRDEEKDRKTDTKKGLIHDLGTRFALATEVELQALTPKPAGRSIPVPPRSTFTIAIAESSDPVRSLELRSHALGEVVLQYTPKGKKPMIKNIRLKTGKSIEIQVLKEGGVILVNAAAVGQAGALEIVPPKK